MIRQLSSDPGYVPSAPLHSVAGSSWTRHCKATIKSPAGHPPTSQRADWKTLLLANDRDNLIFSYAW